MAWSETDILEADPVAFARLLVVSGTAQVLTDVGPAYARDLRVIDDVSGMFGRTLVDSLRAMPRAQDFGAVCDGGSRPVSQWFAGGARDRGYANLAALQVDFPHVLSSTDEIDWAAAQAALNTYGAVNLSGVIRVNRSLQLSGAAKLITGQGRNLTTFVTSSVNLPFITITGAGLGHVIKGIGGVYETLQTISDTNACLVAAELDATVSEKVIEQLVMFDVKLQDGYAVLGVSSAALGSNPISISSSILEQFFADNCCKVIDWVTNSRVGYFTRAWINTIQAYNSRAGVNGYIVDLSKINRVLVAHLSTDRQLDNGRIIRADTGVGLTLHDISAADLLITDTNPLIMLAATQAVIEKLYVNIGTHASASFTPGGVHPIVRSLNGRVIINNVAIKADQPTKLVDGTLTLVASENGGAEVTGIDLEALATMAAASSGSAVKVVDPATHAVTARLSKVPALTAARVYSGDATALSSPLTITDWSLINANAYIFKTTLSADFTFLIPSSVFVEGQAFTVIRQAAGAGIIYVKVGATTLGTLTGVDQTKRFVFSQTALNGWYVI